MKDSRRHKHEFISIAPLMMIGMMIWALGAGCHSSAAVEAEGAVTSDEAPAPATTESEKAATPQTASAAAEPETTNEAAANEAAAAGAQAAAGADAGAAAGAALGVASGAVAAGGADTGPDVFPVKPGEWPMWGGSVSRNLVNTVETGIPYEWNLGDKRKNIKTKNIKWSAKLGSQSYGNPAIVGGKIFVGTNNEAKRNPKIVGDKGVVMCFSQANGKFLWQATHDKLEAGRVNDWPEQGVCSSPVVQDGRVYYVSNRCELVCADAEGFLDGENDGPFKDEKYKDPIDGDFIWVLDLMDEMGVFPHNIATCSPLVVNDMVFILTSNGVERDHITIPNPRAPSFVAVNKDTGEVVWANNDPGENILHGQWAAPTYVYAGGQSQIVFPGGDGWLRSYDPKTGDMIWEFDCNPKDSKWELGGRGTRNSLISTPAVVGGIVYAAVGQDPEHGEGVGHLYAIDASKRGDITKSGRIWHYGGKEFKRTISSFAVADGLVYAADLSGFFHCIDQKTGRPYWVHDTFAAVWGSPTVIDGKVFLGDEDGDVVVLEHGKKMKVLAETNMDDAVYSTPVAVDGVLYIMTRTHLYAIQSEK